MPTFSKVDRAWWHTCTAWRTGEAGQLWNTGQEVAQVAAAPTSLETPTTGLAFSVLTLLAAAPFSYAHPVLGVQLPIKCSLTWRDKKGCIHALLALLLPTVNTKKRSVTGTPPSPGARNAPPTHSTVLACFAAPSNPASSVVLPPIPKYARRNHAACTPMSQQLVPGPGLSHANTHVATYPNSPNYPYTYSQHAPTSSSQVGSTVAAPAAPAPASRSPHALATVAEDGAQATGSQVHALPGSHPRAARHPTCRCSAHQQPFPGALPCQHPGAVPL